ncbi:MAG: hypothetical protein ACT4PO_03190 [Actinomycetota bacterium]
MRRSRQLERVAIKFPANIWPGKGVPFRLFAISTGSDNPISDAPATQRRPNLMGSATMSELTVRPTLTNEPPSVDEAYGGLRDAIGAVASAEAGTAIGAALDELVSVIESDPPDVVAEESRSPIHDEEGDDGDNSGPGDGDGDGGSGPGPG